MSEDLLKVRRAGMFVPNFMAIHPTGVEIFHSEAPEVTGLHHLETMGAFDRIFCQSNQYLLQYFSPDQSGEPSH